MCMHYIILLLISIKVVFVTSEKSFLYLVFYVNIILVLLDLAASVLVTPLGIIEAPLSLVCGHPSCPFMTGCVAIGGVLGFLLVSLLLCLCCRFIGHLPLRQQCHPAHVRQPMVRLYGVTSSLEWRTSGRDPFIRDLLPNPLADHTKLPGDTHGSIFLSLSSILP